MMWSLSDQLPSNLFRYVFAISWRHQIALVGLTVIAFVLEIVPLEIQRRVVNNLVKERPFQLVIVLCAAYAGAVLIQGATKLGLNIYRGWVSEYATRDLRRYVIGYSRTAQADASAEARGIGAAMIVAEVEPVGGFVGSSVSEPLLQAGILLSVLGYIVHLDRWMAVAALALFLPQLVFVPLMQGAINRRAGARVWVLRQLGVSTVESRVASADQDSSDAKRIDRVLRLNMAIFKLKFSMNFLMNFCSHLQVVAALLIGGWMVHSDQLAVGGVVAFMSAVGRLNAFRWKSSAASSTTSSKIGHFSARDCIMRGLCWRRSHSRRDQARPQYLSRLGERECDAGFAPARSMGRSGQLFQGSECGPGQVRSRRREDQGPNCFHDVRHPRSARRWRFGVSAAEPSSTDHGRGMTIPDTVSTQTRRSWTVLTPGTFSAATRRAARSRSSVMAPLRTTMPLATMTSTLPRGPQGCRSISARI
jgi:hypothetical protein